MTRWLLFLLLLTMLAYLGVWNAGFVWDDVPLIVQNKDEVVVCVKVCLRHSGALPIDPHAHSLDGKHRAEEADEGHRGDL